MIDVLQILVCSWISIFINVIIWSGLVCLDKSFQDFFMLLIDLDPCNTTFMNLNEILVLKKEVDKSRPAFSLLQYSLRRQQNGALEFPLS